MSLVQTVLDDEIFMVSTYCFKEIKGEWIELSPSNNYLYSSINNTITNIPINNIDYNISSSFMGLLQESLIKRKKGLNGRK